MATSLSLCTSILSDDSRIQNCPICLRCDSAVHSKALDKIYRRKRSQHSNRKQSNLPMYSSQQGGLSARRLTVLAITKGSAKSSESDDTIPSWARPDSEEPPPWANDESNSSTSQQPIEVPFYVYLLASAVTAIAAIGSIFEYVNERPVFGVLKSDSRFYAPLLGFFVFTGYQCLPFCGLTLFKLLIRHPRNKIEGMASYRFYQEAAILTPFMLFFRAEIEHGGSA